MKINFLKAGLIIFVIIGFIYFIFQYVFFKPETQKTTKATGETVALSFTPSTATLDVNEVATTTIKVKPSISMSFRGYHFKATFNKSKIEITDIDYKL